MSELLIGRVTLLPDPKVTRPFSPTNPATTTNREPTTSNTFLVSGSTHLVGEGPNAQRTPQYFGLLTRPRTIDDILPRGFGVCWYADQQEGYAPRPEDELTVRRALGELGIPTDAIPDGALRTFCDVKWSSPFLSRDQRMAEFVMALAHYPQLEVLQPFL